MDRKTNDRRSTAFYIPGEKRRAPCIAVETPSSTRLPSQPTQRWHCTSDMIEAKAPILKHSKGWPQLDEKGFKVDIYTGCLQLH